MTMRGDFPYPLLEDPDELAGCRQWTAEVYRDFFALQRGELSREAFNARYLWRRAVLVLDLTGFTATGMGRTQIDSLLRIFDAHKVCVPVFREFDAKMIRAFADNFVALFETAGVAVDAALEVHRRVTAFNSSGLAGDSPAECCIGIGFGDVYAIGQNLAMGDEMNRASKLGEDVARGSETLLTERAHEALRGRTDVSFVQQVHEDVPFGFYRVEPPG